MVKRTSLSAALHEASGKKAAMPEPPTASISNESNAASTLPPSRQDKKVIAGYFDPAVSKQLKQLALEHDTNRTSTIG